MRKRMQAGILLLTAILLLLPVLPSAALNRYLRVGVNVNLPPFQFINEDGEFAGMHVDILNAIAKNRNFQIEYVPFENNHACLEALYDGEIDLILGMIADSIQDKRAHCTDALTSSQLCMIVQNDALNSGKRITTAIFASDTIKHTLLANLGIHQFIAVGNQKKVYQAHLLHPGSAMIGVKDSLINQLIEAGVSDNYTVRYNYLGAIEFSAVVRSTDAELLRAMNESILQFKASAQYESICNKWLPEVNHDAKLKRTFSIIAAVCIIVVLAVLSYSILMRRIQQVLRRRVAEQTQQIQKANEQLEKQFVQIQDEYDLRNRIIKYSPSGMMMFDLHYTITLMNKSAAAIAGLTASCVGESALEVPVFREILQKEGETVFVQGTTVESGNIRMGASPAQMRAYHYMIHQVIRSGTVVGVLLTVQDVTKAERMQQAEFEKEKSSALTRIAAGIAHEIRNPLMSIRTFATLIGAKGDDRQVQESFARYVPDEVDRINKLIENLIHYAKPSERHAQRVSVSEIVADSIALTKPVLRKGAFQLTQQLEPDLYIHADRDQIKQVLINIMINSIEAMEVKAARDGRSQPLTLDVRVEEKEQKAVVTIRDEGVGMSAEELRICKEPFFSTKETGTGLGLSLCEQYIKENNGTLQIDSVKNEYTQMTLIFERS